MSLEDDYAEKMARQVQHFAKHRPEEYAAMVAEVDARLEVPLWMRGKVGDRLVEDMRAGAIAELVRKAKKLPSLHEWMQKAVIANR